MSPTDRPTLHAAPAVSRAAFFAQLPTEPRPASTPPADDPAPDQVPEPTAAAAPPVPPAPAGFPA